ncbi:MAG: 3-dehydroquinate synthase [Planctomycetota bacterium]|nr:3-dehydroquinate synthase [Planctomycetota bacterium]MDP6369789.1 3-dehydroquinate synthase [Planctomycetota bacterium]MDP6519255.1 3-dehydroquinate synthase [Planctomycetota bacterium]MDP6838356.1 3-dehydroquinate synthase [Planctomycetota bacterium]MDP6955024.1 3-dehydroquinate synthase [Planctomycetota bacterium]
MDRTAVTVPLEPPSFVHVGTDLLSEVQHEVTADQGVVVISDDTVRELHGAALEALAEAPTFSLPAGEDGKTLPHLEKALDFMAASGLERNGLVITLGGGSVSDLGGLAASLYKRGISVLHCPTTLLAQVDASVGGKTAVNLAAGKNLAGTFHQPRAVFCDVRTLTTLPPEQCRSGLGEVVKTALLSGYGFFDFLEANHAGLAAGETNLMREVVLRCVRLKAGLVATDETDQGQRQVLNLGHTFAHAIEHVSGYGRVPHGVAVAVGLTLALAASNIQGLLADQDLAGRTEDLLRNLGLPASLPELRERHGLLLPSEKLIAAMLHDKKSAAGLPRFVLLQGPGEAVRGREITAAVLDFLLE